MKCRKHQSDYTSEIGVCASCIRERLFSLISSQAREERRESEAQPPPALIFPRSVSPYACGRNLSNGCSNLRNDGKLQHSVSEQRFFCTPQVWSSTGDVVIDGDGMKKNNNNIKKKKNRFSVFSNLFRSKSDKVRMDSAVTVSNSGDSDVTITSSPSWFTTMLSSNRRKKSRLFSFRNSTSRASNSNGTNGYQHRGPHAWEEEDEDSFERSSGYSSESSYGYKRRTTTTTTTRKTTESARRSGAGRPIHSRNVSGPLVRARTDGKLNQKGMPIENMNSGDIRLPAAAAAAKTQLSNASSLRSNRSQKLSDFGRFNHDH